MSVVSVRRAVATSSLVVLLTDVAAAQPTDAADIVALPGAVKAALSFVLVALTGAVILHSYEARVDRSLDALLNDPYSAIPYGFFAYVLALAVGLYGLSQLGRIGVAGTVLGSLGALLIIGTVVTLTAFGFLVLGTLVTEIQGARRPRYGLVLGAGLSAVGWLVLPTSRGILIWVLGGAFGIGGAVRRWFHAEHSVETEQTE